MSTLSFVKQQKFEKLFEMNTGYILDFSNRTFQGFVADSIGIDIYEKYPNYSKAWILRNIIKDFSDAVVGKLLLDLLEYYEENFQENINHLLLNGCKEIANNLKNNISTNEIQIQHSDSKEYYILLDEIKYANLNDKPEVIIDRLHTLCVKFIRDKLENLNISNNQNKSLNALFGLYIKELEKESLIENEITKNILKHNISVLEKFNEIRNNKSLAHDNKLINNIEARYIVNNIIELINFINLLEEKNKKLHKNQEIFEISIDDLPF